MALAYCFASTTLGLTQPNPCVGAVIIRNNRILAYGSTQEPGSHHAEIMAIKKLKENKLSHLENLTLYVTLEPCFHHSRTPPCIDTILEENISLVVIHNIDIHEKVNGRSIEKLKKNNIDVIILENKKFDLAQFFTLGGFQYVQKKCKPRMIYKWAQTKEGYLSKTHDSSGKISNDLSHETVMHFREIFTNTCVTPGAIVHDLPSLNLRKSQKVLIEENISSFTAVLLNRDQLPEQFFQNTFISRRFFLMPELYCQKNKQTSWTLNKLKGFINKQIAIDMNFYLLFINKEQANPVLEKIENKTIINNIFQVNYNNPKELNDFFIKQHCNDVFFETGPKWAQKIYNMGKMKYFIVYLTQTSFLSGRDFELSKKLSQDTSLFNQENTLELKKDIFYLKK